METEHDKLIRERNEKRSAIIKLMEGSRYDEIECILEQVLDEIKPQLIWRGKDGKG